MEHGAGAHPDGHQADRQPGAQRPGLLAQHGRLGARHALGALGAGPPLVGRGPAEVDELGVDDEPR